MFRTPQELYKSKEWIDLRNYLYHKRLNEKGLLICAHCGKPIVHKYDAILHHKTELTNENVNDVNISLNPDMLEFIHFKCHNKEHQRFGHYKSKVVLVHGNICSGKEDFINENATKDDVIVDIDKLWMAISINPKYVKPNRLKPVVFALRTCLYEQIKMRNGMPFTYYVLTTETSPLARKRLCQQLGVDEIIHIDTPAEECLERLLNNPQGRDIELYKGLIEDYAKKFKED